MAVQVPFVQENMAKFYSVLLIWFAIIEVSFITENHQSMSNAHSLSNAQELNFEICFKAFSNSSLEFLKSTLKNASSSGKVNLTLYNIYVVHSETRTEPAKGKRPTTRRGKSSGLETWQVVVIVGFAILLIMAIVIYRLYTQCSKFKRQAILAETVANSSGSFAYSDPYVRAKSFSKVEASQSYK